MSETRTVESDSVPARHGVHDHASTSGRFRLRRRFPFLWHAAEMEAAMGIGMMILGGLISLGFAASGLSAREESLQHPVAAVLVMGLIMAAPMVAWMRYRRHSWERSAEMGVLMFLPAVPFAFLLGAGVMVYTAVCGPYCAIMTVLMLLLMVYRRAEYSAHVS